MEFIKDKWSLLVKCDNEEIAKRINQGINTLLNKSAYEDELGLYDIEGNILQYWTIKNYFTIATMGDEIDLLEETVKKLLARFGVTESKSPIEALDVSEALDMIEEAGINTNSIQRSQISFSLYELKDIMKDESIAALTAQAIKAAAVSTIRNFFKGVEIPGSLSKADLRFHVQINKGGKDEDPYFMFFIHKAPGIEELFKKAFTADIDVDDEGWCTKFALPQDYLRQALNEFLMNL